jgi:hypothetical protein
LAKISTGILPPEANVGIRRKVINGINSTKYWLEVCCLIKEVNLVNVTSERSKELTLARREVVKDMDFMAEGDESVREITPYVTSASGHQNLHELVPLMRLHSPTSE